MRKIGNGNSSVLRMYLLYSCASGQAMLMKRTTNDDRAGQRWRAQRRVDDRSDAQIQMAMTSAGLSFLACGVPPGVPSLAVAGAGRAGASCSSVARISESSHATTRGAGVSAWPATRGGRRRVWPGARGARLAPTNVRSEMDLPIRFSASWAMAAADWTCLGRVAASVNARNEGERH